MIGGTDVVIRGIGDSAALEACARIVQRSWPRARFEDADTGDKYAAWDDIPSGQVRELFAYPNEQSEAAWDEGSPEAPANSMLYLLLSADGITAVLDDPSTAEMQMILDSIRTLMRERTLSPDMEEQYVEVAA
jgi:hypothetical protein